MGRQAIMAPRLTPLSDRELMARVFRTLGDARRLGIIELLLEFGEMSQSELFGALGIPQSRASQHLNCLVWCGVVEADRRGRRLYYRVTDKRTEKFLRLARKFLRDNQAAISTCRTIDGLPD